MQQLGWSDGRNVRIDIRWSENDVDRDRRYAAELVALAPDVVLASGTLSVTALQHITRTLPIVFVRVSDPVGAGFVDSLARPGGNTTGFMLFEYSSSGKWLEFLKQIVPSLTRVAILRDPSNPAGIAQFGAIQAAAQSFGVEVSPISVRDAEEIERALAAFARSANGGLIVTPSAGVSIHHDLIIEAAARHKLPAIYAHGANVHRRRLDLLRARFARPVPARSQLHRSHPQGREAGRSSGSGADRVRAGDQSQDRQGARP